MLSILRRYYQRLFFRKKGYSLLPEDYLPELQQSQYWPKEQMSSYQARLLTDLVEKARNESPYYRKVFKEIHDEIQQPSDLTGNYPLITKPEVIDNYNDLKTSSFTDKFSHSTTGSTGDPLEVSISEKAEVLRKASFLRFIGWYGVKPDDKKVLIWRYNRSKEKGISKLKTKLRGRYDIDVYSLSEDNIRTHIRYIENFKPRYIRGYTSGVVEFARLMKEHDLKIKNNLLKVVIVTSEMLYLKDRQLIEEAFECKVANEFGSADGGLFAVECPEGSMHLNDDSVFVDVVEENKIVVTELFNESQPLINYRNDDQLTLSKESCTCGRSLRVVEELFGRTSGFITKPDGSRVNQGIFIDVFAGLMYAHPRAVKKFKAVQKGNSINIQIIPLENYDQDFEEIVMKRLNLKIGTDLTYSIDLVEHIELDPGGKQSYFRNLNK